MNTGLPTLKYRSLFVVTSLHEQMFCVMCAVHISLLCGNRWHTKSTDFGWERTKISVLASSVIVWQPWESYLTALGFNYWSVKEGNNDIANSDVHRSQAGNLQQGDYFFVLPFSIIIYFKCWGREGNLVHLRALMGSQGAARLNDSLSLFFNKSQEFSFKPFGWWARLTTSFQNEACRHCSGTQPTSLSCCENEMRWWHYRSPDTEQMF